MTYLEIGLILWYLLGSFGSLYLTKKIENKITRLDLILGFSICGLGGLVTIFLFLQPIVDKFEDYLSEEIF